jgi:hypothetical protein
MIKRALPLLAVAVLALSACAHNTIKGTSVKDTKENREVYAVVQQAVDAMRRRDANALLALVSEKYFETNATADPQDDYGYTDLRDKLLPESMKVAQEVQLEVEVQEIGVEDGRAHADLRYQSRAHLALPAGTIWESHNDFDRLQLVHEAAGWKIISGL